MTDRQVPPSTASAPARGYSWTPFEPGNTVAQTHGAYSPRRVDPRAAQIAAELLGLPDLPQHLHRPEFGAAVAAWARAEARCQLMADWLMGMDTGGPTDSAIAVLRELGRAEVAAARLRSDLGLTPMAAARLSRDLSASRFMSGAVMTGVERLAAAGGDQARTDLILAEVAAVDGQTAPPEAAEAAKGAQDGLSHG